MNKPFNRKLIPWMLLGFVVIASFGFVALMSSQDPVAERKALKEKKEQEAVENMPKGDPSQAARIVKQSEDQAKKELAELEAQRQEKERTEKEALKRQMQDLIAQSGGAGGAPLPPGMPPGPDPRLAGLERAATESGAAVAESKFFENYGSGGVFKGEGMAVEAMNYSVDRVEETRGDQAYQRRQQYTAANNPAGNSAPNSSRTGGGYGSASATSSDNPFDSAGSDSRGVVGKNRKSAYEYDNQPTVGVADAVRPLAPASEFILAEGSVVRGVLVTSVNSQVPGTVIVRTTEDVYDSIKGTRLVIPRGSRLVGGYKNDVNAGQERIGIAFRRMLLTDGRSVDLPDMQGAGRDGSSGVSGDYHSNLWRAIGPAALVGLVGQWLEPKQESGSVNNFYGSGSNSSVVQQVFPKISERVLERSQGAKPYFTVDAGTPLAIVVTADIVVPSSSGKAKLLKGSN